MEKFSSLEETDIWVPIKNLNLIMENHIFDKGDPSIIFAFLTHFLNKAHILNMSEAHAFVTLPALVYDLTKTLCG